MDYGASAIRTDRFTRRFLREACAGLFPAARPSPIVPDTPLPQGPMLWISWHECNLIALALHSLVSNRTAVAFVPPGMKRSAMSAWLSGLGVAPVPLAPDTRRGLALRQMEAALGSEKDVLIAVDGPIGP